MGKPDLLPESSTRRPLHHNRRITVRSIMSRAAVVVSLSAALFFLVAVFHVATFFEIDDLDFFGLGGRPRPQSAYASQEEYFQEEFLKKKQSSGDQYLLGVGKGDITGPVVELNYMGYADLAQIGSGLRQRLYARTFIVGDPKNPKNRFVYMVLDTQSGDTAIRYGIIDGLAALGKDYSVYGQSNIAVVGTHSHSGPGAWLNYLLPTITSKGFDKQSYNAIVNGSIASIRKAHESLTTGTLSFGSVDLQDANINRSPYAYLANPASERKQYNADVDKFMDVLRFTNSAGKDMGILTWFPVHGTSLYGNNTLATGDNKGIAMDMFEKSVKGGKNIASNFVAGFSQANVGDTSPNTLGAWCEDGSNVQCTFEQSLCSGKTQNCHGRGPNFTVPDNGATSALTIGTRQFAAAKKLFDNWTGKPVTGSAVRAFHTFQNMEGFKFKLPNGTEITTCAAALGHSFAAGTSDWPGAFDFKQGDSGAPNDPLWNAVRDLLHTPSEEQQACHAPKPILLDVGEQHEPYDWAPNIVDQQVFRVGQLFMIISPGEATTMSGRRWKKAIHDAAKQAKMTGDADPLVVLGGPANTYTHYIATPEEYAVQRYEGASTLYGQHTLDAYINLTTRYLPYLADTPPKTPLTPGPSPPNNVDKALSFITGVVWDTAPSGKKFGDVTAQPASSVSQGKNVSASFVGANPRNDLRQEESYATVEQSSDGGKTWRVVRDDSDYDLVFNWKRTSTIAGTSEVTLQWLTAGSPGTYRFRYYGASKTPILGSIKQFSGTSGTFTVK